MAKVEEYDAQGNLVPEQPDKPEPEPEAHEEIEQEVQQHEEDKPTEDDPAEVKPQDTEASRKSGGGDVARIITKKVFQQNLAKTQPSIFTATRTRADSMK